MEHGCGATTPSCYTGDFVIEAGDELVPISQVSALTPNGH